MTVKQRIKDLIKYLGISQKEFEKRIGASNGYVNSISKSIGAEYLRNIIREYPNISEDWLLYGEGEMLKNQDAEFEAPVGEYCDDYNANMRLHNAIMHLGITQKQLANDVGSSQSAISAIANGTRPMTEGFACRMESIYGINSTWLLTGKGKMLKSGAEPVVVDPVQANAVYLLPSEAAAGSLSLWNQSVMLKDCRKIVSPIPGADFAIQISGNSMEPELRNGSYVYIKKINDKAFIPWGNTMVLDTENGVVVKKVFPVPDNPDAILAKSVNPEYPSYEIPGNSIFGIYRVLGGSYVISTL